MDSLPPYTEEELIGYEKENALTIPAEFRKHLREKSRVICRHPVIKSQNHYFLFDLYEDDPQTRDPNGREVWRCGTGEEHRMFMPADHPVAKAGTVLTTYRGSPLSIKDSVAVCALEYDYLIAKMAIEALKTSEKKFKIVKKDEFGKEVEIAEHGCGETDWLNLLTGKIRYRDFYYNTSSWFFGTCDSFDVYMTMSMGKTADIGAISSEERFAQIFDRESDDEGYCATKRL